MKNFRYIKPVTIQTVTITLEQRKGIDNFLASYRSVGSKNLQVRRIIGGNCIGCSAIPTKKITYTLNDAKLLEWYCDNCFNPNNIGK